MIKEIIHNPVTGETLYILKSNAELIKFGFRLRPGGGFMGQHFQPLQTRIIKVLSGELNCQIGQKRQIIRTDETVTIPAGTAHRLWNPTRTEIIAIEELRPSAGFHVILRILAALAWDGKTDAEGLPHPLISAAFSAEFKNVIRPARWQHRLLFGLLTPLSQLLGYGQIIRNYLKEFENSPARGHISPFRKERPNENKQVSTTNLIAKKKAASG